MADEAVLLRRRLRGGRQNSPIAARERGRSRAGGIVATRMQREHRHCRDADEQHERQPRGRSGRVLMPSHNVQRKRWRRARQLAAVLDISEDRRAGAGRL